MFIIIKTETCIEMITNMCMNIVADACMDIITYRYTNT